MNGLLDVFSNKRRGKLSRMQRKKQHFDNWAPGVEFDSDASNSEDKVGEENSESEDEPGEVQETSDGDEDDNPEENTKTVSEGQKMRQKGKKKRQKIKLQQQGIYQYRERGFYNIGKGKRLSKTREQLDKLFSAKKDAYEITSFSMDDGGIYENDEDREDGYYRRHKDGDNWYNQWQDEQVKAQKRDSNTIEKTLTSFARAHSHHNTKEKPSISHEDISDEDNDYEFDPIATRKIVLSFLKPKENVLQALRRLGKHKKRKNYNQHKRNRQRNQRNNLNIDKNTNAKEELTVETKKHIADQEYAFGKLTAAAQELLAGGNLDIYEETFEHIAKIIKNHAAKKAEEEKRAKDREESGWQYKWSLHETSIHGPFNSFQMTQWRARGYFRSPTVVARQVGRRDEQSDNIRKWTPVTHIASFISGILVNKTPKKKEKKENFQPDNGIEPDQPIKRHKSCDERLQIAMSTNKEKKKNDCKDKINGKNVGQSGENVLNSRTKEKTEKRIGIGREARGNLNDLFRD